MSDVKIVLKEDNPVEPSKSKSWHLSLPADAAVKHLLDALIPKLGLPTQRQDGHPIVYKLYHAKSGNTLSGSQTLSSAGVQNDDLCLLSKEQSMRTRPQKAPLPQIPDVSLMDAANDIIAKSYALLSETCGRDGRSLVWNDSVVCCPICGTPYHSQCWLNNGNRCSNPGCEGSGTVHPQELVDQFFSMSELIDDLMEKFPPDPSNEMEEVFETLEDVDFQLSDRWDELDEEETEELFKELEEEGTGLQEFRDDMEGLQKALSTIDIPSRLKYTTQHVWIDTDSRIGRCGITDFLAQQIFLVLDIGLPEVGWEVTAGEVVSTIVVLTESTQEFSVPVPSPVGGVISEVNKSLEDRFLREAELGLIQDDPYGEGWLFSIQVSHDSRAELKRLMNATTYKEVIRGMLKS
jgi:glycine cleavage system H protein